MNAERSKMRRFELLFDEPPADRAAGRIAERLRCQRVTRLMQAWQKHRERELTFSPLSAAGAFFSWTGGNSARSW
jgi:hypothetical protein